ncbi:MAG: hypothetical protein MN733_14715, partial [Nitrososphaera sp.]|nr:hypothetical protein [Nitrososphaera sp.]
MSATTSSFSATFKLKLYCSPSGEIGLKIRWEEENREVVLPDHLWPEDSDDLKRVARLAFHRYDNKLKAMESKKNLDNLLLQRAKVEAGLMERQVEVP